VLAWIFTPQLSEFIPYLFLNVYGSHMARLFVILPLLILPVLSGCSTLKTTDDPLTQTSSDPIEGYNRAVYAFNTSADKLILKPIAKTYDVVLPSPAKKGVTNFFNNLGEPLNAINNLMQGKLERALSSTYRFVVNSTVGLFGLIDVAKLQKVDRATEDLGQTLASWGVGPGSYIILPFLGPTNVRDGFGRITSNFVYFPNKEIGNSSGTRNGLTALELIDTRVSLLGTDRLVDKQVDPYSFIKSAYDQSRLRAIYDGAPPLLEDDFNF
jgi:phospholipid-binding lipoprotein MlaA